jgi:hypothetical protein
MAKPKIFINDQKPSGTQNSDPPSSKTLGTQFNINKNLIFHNCIVNTKKSDEFYFFYKIANKVAYNVSIKLYATIFILIYPYIADS